jgi:hypothetical protein
MNEIALDGPCVRELEDVEIARICMQASERDRALAEEFAPTMGDALYGAR